MTQGTRITELTTALVAYPTHEREQHAQEHLSTILEAAGFTCELQEVEPDRPNLVARRGEAGTFLCTHIDTHPPHAHPDPFALRVQGELLVGRGALDAKGQIAALVTAVEAEPDAPALVAITCDEEFGGIGSEHIRLPDGPWQDEGGVVLEPTGLRICTAQTGHVDVHIEASAPAGHAYAPQADHSPIDAVLDAVETLRGCAALDARHPLLGPPRAHLGLIRGGEHLWRTPARARAEVAVGLVPGVDLGAAEADVRERLEVVAHRWGDAGMSFLFDITDSSEPYEAPDDLGIASKLAAATGEPLRPAGMPSWTDAAYLDTFANVPCVVFGAGDLGAAHSNHEWVRLSELVELSEILRALLRSA